MFSFTQALTRSIARPLAKRPPLPSANAVERALARLLGDAARRSGQRDRASAEVRAALTTPYGRLQSADWAATRCRLVDELAALDFAGAAGPQAVGSVLAERDARLSAAPPDERPALAAALRALAQLGRATPLAMRVMAARDGVLTLRPIAPSSLGAAQRGAAMACAPELRVASLPYATCAPGSVIVGRVILNDLEIAQHLDHEPRPAQLAPLRLAGVSLRFAGELGQQVADALADPSGPMAPRAALFGMWLRDHIVREQAALAKELAALPPGGMLFPQWEVRLLFRCDDVAGLMAALLSAPDAGVEVGDETAVLLMAPGDGRSLIDVTADDGEVWISHYDDDDDVVVAHVRRFAPTSLEPIGVIDDADVVAGDPRTLA